MRLLGQFDSWDLEAAEIVHARGGRVSSLHYRGDYGNPLPPFKVGVSFGFSEERYAIFDTAELEEISGEEYLNGSRR